MLNACFVYLRVRFPLSSALTSSLCSFHYTCVSPGSYGFASGRFRGGAASERF